jgi:hypothetical protein
MEGIKKPDQDIQLSEHDKQLEQRKSKLHENVPNLFTEAELPLYWEFEKMLKEDLQYQGGRKGSGYTTTFRVLAKLLKNKSVNQKSRLAYEIFDFNKANLDYFPNEEDYDESQFLKVIKDRLDKVKIKVEHPSHLVFVNMIEEIIFDSENNSLVEIPQSLNKSEVGTCTTAEIYFFDFGPMLQTNEGFNVGRMEIIVDENNRPILLQKVGMGESSCISLVPLKINNVELPIGSLIEAVPKENPEFQETNNKWFPKIININQFEGFNFLRITTFTFPPETREEVFGNHYHEQHDNDFVNYNWMEIKHYRSLVEGIVGQNSPKNEIDK